MSDYKKRWEDEEQGMTIRDSTDEEMAQVVEAKSSEEEDEEEEEGQDEEEDEEEDAD
jgi:hypothetical protein